MCTAVDPTSDSPESMTLPNLSVECFSIHFWQDPADPGIGEKRE